MEYPQASPNNQPGGNSCDLLLTAAIVVTQDSERRVIPECSIAITDGKIDAIGPSKDFLQYTVQNRRDLGNALVMPGLINAHTHVSMTFFRGLADDLPLMEWLVQHIFPREKHLTSEIVELGALLGCAEMTRTGTTAFADMYLIEDAVAAAADKAGLRCLMGEGIFVFPSPAFETSEEAFALIRRQAKKYNGHPRIRVAVMPHSVYTTSPEILENCRDLAAELGLPIQIHLAETQSEVDACREIHGKRPVAYCCERGILGATTSIAHGVILDDGELDLLAQTGTHIVHNPRSNMKLASGIARLPDMLIRNMLPALGTDGAASNNALNMFAEMSMCSLLHKVNTMDPTVCPAGRVLDMATHGGAAALNWPELGRLQQGGPADLIALNLDSPNLQPLYSAESQIVYAATGHEVNLTMVAGNILYDEGIYHALDYPVLLREAQKLREWVLKNS